MHKIKYGNQILDLDNPDKSKVEQDEVIKSLFHFLAFQNTYLHLIHVSFRAEKSIKALPRTVKIEDHQLLKMRRKRRKAYKKWKLLNPTICEPQPANQACQKTVKDHEKEIKGDTSEAVFHHTGALGKSKENGEEHTSASMNEKQSSFFLPKDKKRPPSESNIRREKENDDSPPPISHQPKKVLPVVMFNDCGETLSGKIPLQDFPNTVESFRQERGKTITQVKCGDFNVQVTQKNRLFCKTEMQFPTKKRCPKCHQYYPARCIQRCYSSRSHSSKYKTILIEEIKSEPPSKYKEETARTESPSLEVSIVGKGIKVKYMSKKQNITINIIHPKIGGKTAKYRSVSSDHTTKECPRLSVQSGIRLPEKWQLEDKLQSSVGRRVSSPIVLAAHKEEKHDTAVVSLCSTPKRKKEPDTLSSVLGDCELESATSQQKAFKIGQSMPETCFFEAETLLKNVFHTTHDTLKTRSLSETDLSKMPFEDPKNVDRDRKINFDIPENTTADLYTQQSTEGINYSPCTITNIFPAQNGKDSDFYSSSSLNAKHIGEKAANIYCKGSKIAPAKYCENSNSKSFPSSQNTVMPPTPFCPSHWATRYSKPKESPGNTFSFAHCAGFVIDFEDEQVDVTDRNSNKATLHSDCLTNVQQVLETKSTQYPIPSLASSSGLAAGSPLSRSSHSSVQWGQTESQATHAETTASSNTKVSGMTSITDELEQRLIIQSDKEGTVDSNCPMGMKNLKESPSFLGNVERDKFLMRPVVKNTCHRDFETLSNENHDEVCFQMDFPPNTAEFSSAGCTADNLFLIEKPMAGDADQYSNQDEINPGLTSFKQEAAECQRIASIRPNCEGDKNDPQENCYHQIDILLSPQKQKALKVTSEDGCSVDLGFRVDIEEKCFYTENFHSAAWVFQGDDGNPEDSPRCLSKKPRPVAVRERTVRLFKRTGDYPWGFRIQFSKPIVVTEVDTNSAAEEAGLQIGDVVLAINGTKVTSVEHAEAVHLARKGPDVLTLVVGSDISRCPNTPWPACRGYLHKRTHSGLVKGWRKRWFVLKHDGCLRYYRHKKDEGKCPPLGAITLAGAEVNTDSSLGKPFVFSCVPQSGNRTFCLCATSNQEMKRWLEAMNKAVHPVRQNHVWEDVTLHNSSLPPLAIKSPECLGLLHQLDRSTDSWVQHYCILKDGCLYFYASIRSTQASGGLYLQGYKVNEQTLSFKQSVIELKPPSEEFQTFYFCAENNAENQRWITALKTSIKKWLPLHQAIQDFISGPLEETRM
ncbi:uncharacterized protein LOC118499499 isoform X4 [Phyllostomus discolor]|uniref:Uncharacterized protein LOC118499499 isoform X4 n=1 Tax=Phyllostomus discolor TaxID=89673 RepID=A0A7E6DAZ3_9CHIR|nr:uncharacterized protein LOC118499499 isoform X4 [Phyllostomus discolor]